MKYFAILILLLTTTIKPAVSATEDVKIALSLAELLRSARTVISRKQTLINDKNLGDKGLNGTYVLQEALKLYNKSAAKKAAAEMLSERHARLFDTQKRAIVKVMNEHQGSINRKGVGFKGFVPAVFTRLVNECFKSEIGSEAEIKVTAPVHLVRNRKARPDTWETQIIADKLQSPTWVHGQSFHMLSESNGRKAFRMLLPEYYSQGCLSCHGGPKGEMDITGYPKEGGVTGDLAGAISITLYR